MFRGLVMIVTVAAVLWHTVSGCCAHHSHGGHSCDLAGNAASLAHDSDSEVSGGCCKHVRTDSKQFGASESSGQQLGENSHGAPCPADRPAGCKEGTCVFTVPDSSAPSPIDQLARVGSFLSYAVVDSAALLSVSYDGELHESVAPPLLGGVRLHLAHCVLTL